MRHCCVCSRKLAGSSIDLEVVTLIIEMQVWSLNQDREACKDSRPFKQR